MTIRKTDPAEEQYELTEEKKRHAATGKITGHQDYPTNGKLPNSEE